MMKRHIRYRSRHSESSQCASATFVAGVSTTPRLSEEKTTSFRGEISVSHTGTSKMLRSTKGQQDMRKFCLRAGPSLQAQRRVKGVSSSKNILAAAYWITRSNVSPTYPAT